MIPAERRRFVWCAVVVLIVLLTLVAPTNSPRTTPISPITFGEVSMEFSSPPMPDRPWEVLIVAKRLTPTDYGQLTINEGVRERVLWEGAVSAGDSIVQRASFQPPPPGLYGIRATYIACPGCSDGIKAATIVVNLLVREDTVFLERSWPGENWINELNYDLRKRGLDGVDPKLLDSLAPDLAERWRKIRGWHEIGPPPRPKVQSANPSPGSIIVRDPGDGPHRDTLVIPGSGPPSRDSLPIEYYMRLWGRDTIQNPRRTWPGPPVKPGDSEFGRSEEARRLLEDARRFADSMKALEDSTATKKPHGGGE